MRVLVYLLIAAGSCWILSEVAQTPSTTITAFMKASPVFGTAGALATLGTSLVGVGVLLHRSNLFEGSALVAMGGLVLRTLRLPPVPSVSRSA